jgi:hypothetical protein
VGHRCGAMRKPASLVAAEWAAARDLEGADDDPHTSMGESSLPVAGQ